MNRTLIVKQDLDHHTMLSNEWLVTNGLGGFSASSLACCPMRKYHALLVASLPAPHGRVAMLSYIEEILILADGREIPLSFLRHNDKKEIPNIPLVEFRLEMGLPIWRYHFEDIVIEKSLFLIYMQNTLQISYKVVSSTTPIKIKWSPYFHFRLNEQSVDIPNEPFTMHTSGLFYEIECPSFPTLRFYNIDPQHQFTNHLHTIENVYYEVEAQRGYPSIGKLTSPGYYILSIPPHEKATVTASTENWESISALSPTEAMMTEKFRRKQILKTAGPIVNSSTIAKLVLAADDFVMKPLSRHEDVVRLQAAGEQVESVIAGYPWFTDWGRDTMISFEGLTLTTGRVKEAHAILRTFAHYVKDGLIPNMFPDGENQGIYNTADATLWFFHAVNRFIEVTGDDDILEFLLPKFKDIIKSHIQGTKFGIHVAEDGLLVQGQAGFQLTWMDAKVGDWVVTPRRGKAVEINALWYNALKLMESWTGKQIEITQKCYDSFNQKFWYEEGGYLYDVIDGENGSDSALRPNQLFAISLKNPVLAENRWKSVLDITKKELLTPVGLRTLTPTHQDYKVFYDGDLRSRDAAYHQGTVWPWLIGPFIDVWLKVYPNDLEAAKGFLAGLKDHLETGCLGNISEIFDATEPYTARGCFAQAWSVAELLRCLVKVNPQLKDTEVTLEPLITHKFSN